MEFLDPSAPPVTDARKAIRRGDVAALESIVAAMPALATARIGDPEGYGTLLHDLADSPGHVPNGPASLRVLLAAGADIDAHRAGGHQETPLHYAASNDDVELVEALLDAGADIEAYGSVSTVERRCSTPALSVSGTPPGGSSNAAQSLTTSPSQVWGCSTSSRRCLLLIGQRLSGSASCSRRLSWRAAPHRRVPARPRCTDQPHP
jgi:hypothetical protein